MSLDVAFHLAGADSLIVSPWMVPDQQRRELMQDFYAHLLAGTPRIEALRKALDERGEDS